MINDDKCIGCPFATFWSGFSVAEYPACSHPDSGPRAVNLLSEMDKCPKEDS